MDSDSSLSLGRLFHWITVLTETNKQTNQQENKTCFSATGVCYPCLLPVALCEEKASVLFMQPLKYWNTVMVLPLSLLVTPETKCHSLTLSSSGGFCSPLWCSLGCSPVCLCLSQLWGQIWTQLCLTSTGWSRMITSPSLQWRSRWAQNPAGWGVQGLKDGTRSLQGPGGRFLLFLLLRMWQVGLAPSTAGARLWNEKAKQLMRWLRVLLGQSSTTWTLHHNLPS